MGFPTITVGLPSGQTLRLDIYLSHDLTQELASHSFSLNFDTALNDDLDLGPMAPVEWAGTNVDPGTGVSTYGPITAGFTTTESTLAVAGRIDSYESGSFTGVLPRNSAAYTVGTSTATAPARYRIGQAFFTVNSVTTDVVSGLFSGLFDLQVDGLGVTVPPGTITFGTAAVNVIPEPGTVSLLGLGLVGLVLARRRRRS